MSQRQAFDALLANSVAPEIRALDLEDSPKLAKAGITVLTVKAPDRDAQLKAGMSAAATSPDDMEAAALVNLVRFCVVDPDDGRPLAPSKAASAGLINMLGIGDMGRLLDVLGELAQPGDGDGVEAGKAS